MSHFSLWFSLIERNNKFLSLSRSQNTLFKCTTSRVTLTFILFIATKLVGTQPSVCVNFSSRSLSLPHCLSNLLLNITTLTLLTLTCAWTWVRVWSSINKLFSSIAQYLVQLLSTVSSPTALTWLQLCDSVLSLSLSLPSCVRMVKLINSLTIYFQKLKSVSSKLLCASCAAFFTSSLPSGYNLGVINTPRDILKDFCNSSLIRSNYELSSDQLDLLWSAVVSVFLLGAMIGSAMNAWASNQFGRKLTIIISSLIALAAAVLFIAAKFADSVLLIIIGRALSGIHCGLASCLVPMYLIEISPRDLREAIGILHCFGMTMGILIAQVLGQEDLLGTSQLWPYLLALYSVFIGIGFTMMISAPESPVYLFMDCNEQSKALEGLSAALFLTHRHSSSLLHSHAQKLKSSW